MLTVYRVVCLRSPLLIENNGICRDSTLPGALHASKSHTQRLQRETEPSRSASQFLASWIPLDKPSIHDRSRPAGSSTCPGKGNARGSSRQRTQVHSWFIIDTRSVLFPNKQQAGRWQFTSRILKDKQWKWSVVNSPKTFNTISIVNPHYFAFRHFAFCSSPPRNNPHFHPIPTPTPALLFLHMLPIFYGLAKNFTTKSFPTHPAHTCLSHLKSFLRFGS